MNTTCEDVNAIIYAARNATTALEKLRDAAAACGLLNNDDDPLVKRALDAIQVDTIGIGYALEHVAEFSRLATVWHTLRETDELRT